MKDTNKRSSNIELLRIVLIFMVITSHFIYSGMGNALSSTEESPFNWFPLTLLGSFSVCAVNCFMIISGYFLSENKTIKLSKILDLLILVVFYRFVSYLASVATGSEFFSASKLLLCCIPVNYFAIFYVITYAFSPFLSILFDALNPKKQKLFTLLSLLLFVLYPTLLDMAEDLTGRDMTIISSISSKGNAAGYSIVQFLTMCILGMYLKRSRLTIKKGILAIVFLLSSCIMTFCIDTYPSLYNYCSIFTVINAICLFLFFNQLSVNHSAFINTISKSVFGIFCLHTGSASIAFWKTYIISCIPLDQSVFMTLCCWLFSVCIMFISCLAVDLLRSCIFGNIKKKLLSTLPVICLSEN